VCVAHSGSFWLVLVHFGSFLNNFVYFEMTHMWFIMAHFGKFCILVQPDPYFRFQKYYIGFKKHKKGDEADLPGFD